MYKSLSETSRFNVLVVLLETKSQCVTSNKERKTTQISAPPCAFLICVATSWINDFRYVLFLSLLLLLMLFLLFLCHMANFNHGQKSLGQS